jgi:thymidylate synthase ThyX
MYKCEIIADSLSPQGDRLTTYKVTYPRIIHAEMLRHRMLSRNVASSRAIPFKKMVKDVEENPFIPIAFQKDHKGMQGTEYLSGEEYDQAWMSWKDSSEDTIERAKHLHDIGVTKQLCNRLLEPFVWTTELITGTEWDNFFNLRCPRYAIGLQVFRSKKDAVNSCRSLQEPSPECLGFDELDWLSINESQAEIHIQAIAEMMWDSLNESVPKQLEAGEWHIPFGDNIDTDLLRTITISESHSQVNPKLYLIERDLKIKIATARCARISYETLGDNPKIDYEADIKLHDRLIESKHWSPFEHCARAMNYLEHNDFIKGKHSGKLAINHEYLFEDSSKGWCNNFKGFIQYRYLLENNLNL